MDSLLPEKKELVPIQEEWSTFYDSGFNDDFDSLPFKKKLQIINDIVRQTILYDAYPNPEVEVEELIGDSYTASKVLINYLKELNLGENHKIVLAKDGIFDSSVLSHFIVLVENEGSTFQLDCSPTIGYKCGQVEDEKTTKFHDTYIELDDDNEFYLNIIRDILYKINHRIINDNTIREYINILYELPNNRILNDYVFKITQQLYGMCNDEYLKSLIIDISKKVIEINITGKYEKNGIIYESYEVYKKIEELREELNTIVSEDKDYKRQLEIAQCIVAEISKNNNQYNKYLDIGNSKINFTNINPRFFLENGLNVVLLKPSAFKANVTSVIKERYLQYDCEIGEYFANLGSPSETLGLKSMRLFHPQGYKYERSMFGPNDIFLVEQKSDDIKIIKRQFRNDLANEFKNTKLVWYDGKRIVWDPKILNLLHTTDDPCEASLHYLAGYPEYQLMTRFMYPNPKIKELEKEYHNERIRIQL